MYRQKKAIKTIENFTLLNADLTSAETIYIAHTNQEQEAKNMANFDYTMGCSCGPNTLAIFGALK